MSATTGESRGSLLHRLSANQRLSLRAAFCLTVPLVVGIATGRRVESTVFSLGALWAVSQDGSDAWAIRGPRLWHVALAGGAGVAIGSTFSLVAPGSRAVAVLYVVLALIAGLIEASGLAATGMYLLLGTIVGAGFGGHGLAWWAAPTLALGALWVYGVAAARDRQTRREQQRLALADGVEALSATLRSVGTARFSHDRATAVVALDRARDAIGARVPEANDDEGIALYQCLIVALRCGEIVSYLAGQPSEVPSGLELALRQMALHLRSGSALRATVAVSGIVVDGDSSLARAVRSIFMPESKDVVLQRRPFPSTKFVVPLRERWRFALILAFSVGVASVVAHVLDGPKGFWLPLAVAFIMRPDLGPVIPRASARTVGTLLGVVIAALVALTGNEEVVLVGLSCVMAALVPWASARSHLLTVMVFTPIIFVFLGVLGPDQYLFVPRVLDTAIAAVIVLVVDLALWTTAPSLRLDSQYERASRAVSRYLDCTRADGAAVRHGRRRDALRAIKDVMDAAALAGREPLWFRQRSVVTNAMINDLALAIDTHTVRIVQSRVL